MREITSRLFGIFLATALLLFQGHATAEEKVFSTDQLDQLVAPIALYPDPVVAQILMASTYPLEVVMAERWQEQNKNLKGEELDKQAAAQDWDPSVVSMLHFPDVLKILSENLDWTQDLGDAVLAQRKDVMDAVQRMRKRAYDAGNIQSSEQQQVVVEEQIIRIEPTTEVIYVPAYNPTVVYGSWATPMPYYPMYVYPPSYWYPPTYPVGAGLVTFGVGMAFGAAIWGDTDWNNGDIDVDINRNTNINNVNGNWEHNASHRQGVRYRDESTSNRYDQASRNAQEQRTARDTSRGYDRSNTRDLQDDRRDGVSGNRDLASRSDRDATTRDISSRDTSSRDRATATTRDSSSRDISSHDRATASTRDRSSGLSRDMGSSSSRASSYDRSAFSSNRSSSATRSASSRGFSSRSGGGGMSRGGGGRR